MKLHVYNEIGTLGAVLVHTPGQEISRMTQHQLEQLLFDDLLSPSTAHQEHQVFCEVLGTLGAEVLQVSTLLKAALHAAPAEAIVELLRRVAAQECAKEVLPILIELRPDELAAALIQGLRWRALSGAPMTLSRLARRHETDKVWAVHPLPNLMFMRDPCASLYNRVIKGRMATRARERESLLVHFALRYGYVPPVDFLFEDEDWNQPRMYRSLEGGDVLVINEQFLLFGISERTHAATVERLVREELFSAFPHLERVYGVMIPADRSMMHLDTLLTQVDHQLFLGHKPTIEDGEQVQVAVLQRGEPARLLEGTTVLDVLRDELGPGTTLVPCGGHERLYQDREQWTDGANAVCIAPGHIVSYARNERTARTLVEEHGFHQVQVAATDPDALRRGRLAEAGQHPRVIYTFTGSELSRARGGSRCMSMPLYRQR